MKKAFSLIEVIFVLVILGIVASISSQIIVQVYEGYIVQNAIYKTTTKTELVATQIVNRLTLAIDGTTIAKDLINTGTVHGTNWIRLEEIPTTDNNFTTVEWIGAAYDSFSAGETPFWSGLADYETATVNSFVTPASQLNSANTIISNLSNEEVDLNGIASQRPAVIFTQKDKKYNDVISDGYYSPQCMGLIDNNTSCIFPVARNSDNNFSFTTPVPLGTIISERYKLAWSAYALVPEDLDGDGLFDLYLYYNYQPWEGELFTDVENNRKLLMTNVTVFKFTENGGVIQLKLCASENIGQKFNISSCKEKAIIR